MYYRKVANRINWWFVIRNFLKLKHQQEVIKFLSDKFGVIGLYEAWMTHTILRPYDRIVSMVHEYDDGKGQNYQNVLKKIFGAM